MKRLVTISAGLFVLLLYSLIAAISTGAEVPRKTVISPGARAVRPAGCAPYWNLVPSPNAPSSVGSTLAGVTAISENDVWAVGWYTASDRLLTLAEHWDGVQWSTVPSPNPGTYDNRLRSISAVAPNDIWAVGDYNFDPAHPTHHLLTTHWNGTGWSVVPNPDPGGNYENYLTDVDALASNDVWTVGFWRRYSPQGLTMVWNGTDWIQTAQPIFTYCHHAGRLGRLHAERHLGCGQL